MSEKISPQSESAPQTPELSAEQLENYLKAESRIEQAAENSTVEHGEKAETSARHEALKEAVSVERGSAEKKRQEPGSSPAARRHGAVSKKERAASYKRRMKHVQSEMPASQRAFSKVIHAPVIEKTSEVVGSSIARPNAILAGSMVAFFAVLAVYVTARYFGYSLSGFETIGAFIVGWIIGLLFDFFKVMITGKK